MQARGTSFGGLSGALCAGMMALALACVSNPPRPGNNDNGGDGGDGGTGGIEATAGVGGGNGGSAGHAGSGGATAGSGGAGDQGGAAGDPSGGTGGGGDTGGTGGASTGGSGGSGAGGTAMRDAGAPDSGTVKKDAGAGSGPTFTQVYMQIMSMTPAVPTSSCWGSTCHAGPGGKDALAKIVMTSQASAYMGVMKLVTPGNPATSKLFTEINLGKMPEKRPKLSANLIKLVSDWITAGAMNN